MTCVLQDVVTDSDGRVADGFSGRRVPVLKAMVGAQQNKDRTASPPVGTPRAAGGGGEGLRTEHGPPRHGRPYVKAHRTRVK